jgi:hypothetical protein
LSLEIQIDYLGTSTVWYVLLGTPPKKKRKKQITMKLLSSLPRALRECHVEFIFIYFSLSQESNTSHKHWMKRQVDGHNVFIQMVLSSQTLVISFAFHDF